MTSPHCSVIDLLIDNIGITPFNLYKISGIDSKRDFLLEINRLEKAKRIIKEYDDGIIRFKYSPKILVLSEIELGSNSNTKYRINYLSTSSLENELNYINSGTDQEDCLDFELQITGYRLMKKDKDFIEKHTGITLDFTKYEYRLWAEYLNPFPQSIETNSFETIL